MSNNEKKFSHALKEWRTRKGLSQKEVAVRMEMSRSTISFLENGEQLPNTSHIIKFKDRWGIDFSEYLVDGPSPHYGEPKDSYSPALQFMELYNATKEVRNDLLKASDILRENNTQIDELPGELKKSIRAVESLINQAYRKI